MPCAGVLLTGGASHRLGVDKATLLVDGEPLAVRAGRLLARACKPVIEAGSGVSELPAVREEPPGSGPLAGFLAGCDAVQPASSVLLLACDLPFVDEPLLRWLVDQPGTGSFVPTIDGADQYACSRWSAYAIETARDRFRAGERALKALLAAGDVTRLVADHRAGALADVDTLDDLRRLLP
jgi:molybdenum cofactor guanylyltransferase